MPVKNNPLAPFIKGDFLKSPLEKGVVWYAMIQTLEFLYIKLGCLRQRLFSSPLERGAGGVLRQTYTPLYPLFLEGNHTRLIPEH